jgi:hypothetical protein
VKDVKVSRPYYEGLGFHKVEGDDAEGWAVMVNGESRIGLYEAPHMEGDAVCLNFRGGDVAQTAAELKSKGYTFAKELSDSNQGGASARLKDPDGHVIFLDCAPGEAKKV